MKSKIIYLLITIIGFTLYACENTDYQVYDKDQMNKIFFEKDTIRFEYGMTMDKESDLNVMIKLIGLVDLEKDLPLDVVANKELTTAVVGKDYILPENTVFKKDTTSTFIGLDFQKNNLEKNKDYILTLDLMKNDYYEPTDRTRCVIIFANKDIPAPVWWRTDKLGVYQQEKFVLFVDYFHKSKELSPAIYAKIEKTWGENLDKGTATNLLTVYAYQGFLKRYILTPMYEYYLNSGDPNYEIPKP